MTIFLTGYMASGKTTLGRAFAKATGMQFIDLDFYIEQRFHKSIPQIFAERGETGFRRMESALLREVGEFEDAVISCGGGTPCFDNNMDYMNSRGVTVWLDTPIDVICRRLMAAGEKRPIVAGKSGDELKDFINIHLSPRLHFYSKARHKLDGTMLENRKEISDTVNHLISLLKP